MAVIDVFVQNLLLLTQKVETNLKVVSASNHLDLHDTVRTNIHVATAQSRLFLNQYARTGKTISVEAGNTLTLSQSTQPRVYNVEAASYLILIQEVKHEDQWPAINQTLSLSHQAEAVVARGAYDTLTLTQEATFTITRNLSVANALILRSNVRAYKLDKMFINDPDLTVEAP